MRRALDAGADAIVFEPELESTLAVTVSAVGSGQSVVPRKMRASVERPAFSHRERQVLAFVSQGLTNAQIADELFLSESTIKSHLSSAFAKFGVRSRTRGRRPLPRARTDDERRPARPEHDLDRPHRKRGDHVSTATAAERRPAPGGHRGHPGALHPPRQRRSRSCSPS